VCVPIIAVSIQQYWHGKLSFVCVCTLNTLADPVSFRGVDDWQGCHVMKADACIQVVFAGK